MVIGTRGPYVSVCGCVMVRGAAAPNGLMTYAVLKMCDLNLWAGIKVSRLDIGEQALKDSGI